MYKFGKGSGVFFAGTPLMGFDFARQHMLVMDMIREFGEISMFGNRTHWRISQDLRTKVMADVVRLYNERRPDDQLDEEKVYELAIGRFLQLCMCQEEHLFSREIGQEIQRLGLLDPNKEDALQSLFGIGMIHEEDDCTYIGIETDMTDGSPQPKAKGEADMIVLTKAEAMARVPGCIMLISPEVEQHSTIYYVDYRYEIASLPEGYQRIEA